MNDEFYKKLDLAIAAAEKHEKELLGTSGVVAVGAGPRRRAGRITGEAAIVVTVRKKADLGSGNLPKSLDNIPVDVVELGAPIEAPEIVAAQASAKKTLEAIRGSWLRKPNIVGLGVGYKTIKGQTHYDRIALKIFVEQKLSPEDVMRRGFEIIPPDIDGVPTDVEQMARLRPASSASGSRDDRKDPLVGGLTVGVNTKPFWYGTLGAIVFDRATGEQMVLSNQHVLDGAPGTEVVQPSPIGLDDSLDIGFQLDICNPIHFFRLDTPNTTVGSVLAGAAVAAAVAAALSDTIDPTRRGQAATAPPAGAKTLIETQKVRLSYPEFPIPGRHFKINTDWTYTRHTDAGDFSHDTSESKVNPHVLIDKMLLTDKKLYHPGEMIRLFALILPEVCAPKRREPGADTALTEEERAHLVEWAGKTPERLSESVSTTAAIIVPPGCRCERYHATAILTPTTVDKAFPVALRQPVVKHRNDLLKALLESLEKVDDAEVLARALRILRYGCFYVGEMTAESVPTGPWKHYLYVQTLNYATDNLKPTEAAQIIGGLPVSNNMQAELDVACGPIVYEDGQFDIELI